MPRSRASILGRAVLAAALVLAGGAFVVAQPSPASKPPPTAAAATGDFDAGTIWHVEEGPYQGTWTRRSNSDVFDAYWTDGQGDGPPHELYDEITVESVTDKKITLFRKAVSYRYTGTISEDGKSIVGDPLSWSPIYRWAATIEFAAQATTPRVRVSLSDGSWLVGEPTGDGVEVRTAFGTARVKWPDVSSLWWRTAGAEEARMTMSNSDVVTCRVTEESLALKTAMGPIKAPLANVTELVVLTTATSSPAPVAPRGITRVGRTLPVRPVRAAPPTTYIVVKPGGVVLTLTLADGSRLIGEPQGEQVDLKTEHADLKLKWAQIDSITWKPNDNGAGQFTLRNSDTLSGRLGLEKIPLKTILGEVSVPVAQVRQLQVTTETTPPHIIGNGADPEALRQALKQLNPVE